MKGGLVYTDEITTVSPTYAGEIQTAYYGERLDGLLRARKDSLTGILNGIDTDEYNPNKDPMIVQNYNVVSQGKRKAVNKGGFAGAGGAGYRSRRAADRHGHAPFFRRRDSTWSSACCRRS